MASNLSNVRASIRNNRNRKRRTVGMAAKKSKVENIVACFLQVSLKSLCRKRVSDNLYISATNLIFYCIYPTNLM